MRIFLKASSGIEAPLLVSESDTIDIVKAKISAAFLMRAGRAPGGKFFLFFVGQHLQDDRTVSDYNITPGARILIKSEYTQVKGKWCYDDNAT